MLFIPLPLSQTVTPSRTPCSPSSVTYFMDGPLIGVLYRLPIGVQIPARVEIWLEISAPPAPPNQFSYDEYADHTIQWEDQTVRERTGHPPSYAEAKKMKSLTLHTHCCHQGFR